MLVFQKVFALKAYQQTVYEFQIVEAYVCQSFQTLYEASPIINVTQRSFAVFHPIMYVTHRSFAAPAPATRDFFWLYNTYSLLRGVSIMPPRVLAQRPKPCGSNKILFTMFLGLLKCYRVKFIKCFKNISACDYDM